jgi:hypothetical protein
MSAADVLRTFLTPLLPDFRIQFGRWMDDDDSQYRYCIVKPVGGLPLVLVREPQFTLTFIGAKNDSEVAVSDFVEDVIQAMKTGNGGAVFLQPAEPVFMATSDGRPVFDLAVSAIFNL